MRRVAQLAEHVRGKVLGSSPSRSLRGRELGGRASPINPEMGDGPFWDARPLDQQLALQQCCLGTGLHFSTCKVVACLLPRGFPASGRALGSTPWVEQSKTDPDTLGLVNQLITRS